MPVQVRRLIDVRAEAAGFPALKRAASLLSERYREGKPTRLTSDDQVTAYLVTRMPATYAAARAAFDELPNLNVGSVLDIGAGSGAASLAVRERFESARDFTLIERDPTLASAAEEFLAGARIVSADVTTLGDLTAHDLVVAAYSLGEIESNLVGRLWAATRVALVVIEPGTPQGSERIAGIREQLLELGAHMAAPCPAAMACPLGDNDWCHFAARVERTSLHRRLKDGGLGYEDEKFSYVAVTREPAALSGARVLRHPRHHPGLIELELCTPVGTQKERVTKRDKERFRAARKAEWGGLFR
jgi:ribosomal protein RSM22 (predicted rRNA methylase)